MIEVDLPQGTAPPLVRGLAACLASVTEVPLDELPAIGGTPEHALGAWRGWLAGRGSGLVPIADPTSFQWAGWWIGVVDGSPSPLADGPQRSVAVLAFGTPPGVVLSPQDPALLGRATRTRRNVLTRGLDVNALVGRDFTIGGVRCRGLRLAEPCAHLERLHGPGLLRPLIHRGGLRADVLSDGDVGPGSPVAT